MKRLLEVMFWAVLAAAFIGPGTVTTAAASGATFGASLAWALVFSTITCVILQEAAARLTTASGLDLGQSIRARARVSERRPWVPAFVASAIVIGCAAYEAGNILGGVAGARLVLEIDPRALTLVSAAAAAALLWTGRTEWIARVLGGIVAVMAVAFAWTALRIGVDPVEWIKGALVPALPAGSAALALGLVGTTVVPYNLFLGSGLARGRGDAPVRFGLIMAIGLGGLVSLAVMVVGSGLDGPFGFEGMAALLRSELGGAAEALFAVGLLGAGLSSAITAPLAAAIATRSLLGDAEDPRWNAAGARFRAVWIAVLVTGFAFGVSGVRPVPVIVLAQALNGVVLPIVVIFLLIAVNDRRVVGPERMNGPLLNAVSLVCGFASVLLGARGLLGAIGKVVATDPISPGTLLIMSVVVSVAVAIPVCRIASRGRRAHGPRER